jgi:hypothetical protein
MRVDHSTTVPIRPAERPTSYRLGRTINFNPDTQQVIGDEEAQRLLRDGDRGYRAPFVVPEEV